VCAHNQIERPGFASLCDSSLSSQAGVRRIHPMHGIPVLAAAGAVSYTVSTLGCFAVVWVRHSHSMHALS
jgi:hypothetical protein